MDYRTLLSGERKDPIAICLRGALRIAEAPYRLVIGIRNRGFDKGRREIHRADVPVISIGNLTTGGTGKTPLVSYVARYLRSRDLRVAIISRGYGAEAGENNDEAMELARSLPDVPHVQDSDRVEAARIAAEELETEVVIMDDGFQHRRLHRDLDIVVIDATNPFGYDHLLPRGMLREPLDSLSRAGVIILSRADLVDDKTRAGIRKIATKHAANAVWAEVVHAPQALLEWPDKERSLESIVGKKVALVSAIGNPEAFAGTMKRCGAEVVGTKALPDHDRYSRETVVSLESWLKSFEDPSIELVCTHKDLVKLQTDRLAGHRVSALLIEIRFTSGENELREAINAALPSPD